MISLEYFGDSYEKDKFENLKNTEGPATVVMWARKNGVPEKEILKFALEAIDKYTNEGDLFWVYRFRKNMLIGTPDEIMESGEAAYELYFVMKDRETAMKIAEEVWGKESKQYLEASQIGDDLE